MTDKQNATTDHVDTSPVKENGAEPRFKASFVYSIVDLRALAQARRLRKWPQPWRRFAVLLAVYFAAALVSLWWLGELSGISKWQGLDALNVLGAIALGAVAFLAAVVAIDVVFRHWIHRAMFARYSQAGKNIGAEIGEDGIAWRGEAVSGFVGWPAVKDITVLRRRDAAVLWLGKVEGYVLPARAFAAKAEYDAAVAYMKGKIHVA